MAFFERAIYALEYWGIVDVILPFIIVFTIAFAALQKSKVLGEESRKYNVMIALVMGLSVVVPHVLGLYPPGQDVVDIMNQVLPNISLLAIAFVMVLLILGIFGKELHLEGSAFAGILVIIAIIAVAVIFISAAGYWVNTPRWLEWIYDPYVAEFVVIILVFGIIIWFVTGDDRDGKDEENGFMKVLRGIGGMYKR